MQLKWRLTAKGLRPHAQLRLKLAQKIRKLEAHLEHFPPDAVYLEVNLGRQPKKTGFAAALTLHLPSNVLRADKAGPDPIPAFDLAIKAILRELAVLKSALRHERDWRRASARAAVSAAGGPSRRAAAIPA